MNNTVSGCHTPPSWKLVAPPPNTTTLLSFQEGTGIITHANPVLHGFSPSPDRWPYSNYLDWVGKWRGTLVGRSFIAEYYPESGQYAARVQAFITGQVDLPKSFRDYLHGLP